MDDFALLIVAFAAITAYYTIAALTLIKKVMPRKLSLLEKIVIKAAWLIR